MKWRVISILTAVSLLLFAINTQSAVGAQTPWQRPEQSWLAKVAMPIILRIAPKSWFKDYRLKASALDLHDRWGTLTPEERSVKVLYLGQNNYRGMSDIIKAIQAMPALVDVPVLVTLGIAPVKTLEATAAPRPRASSVLAKALEMQRIERVDAPLVQTQTKSHLIENFAAVQEFVTKMGTFYDTKVQNTLLNAYTFEKQEHAAGNYVFWHARGNRWGFRADIYKALFNIANSREKRVGSDFVFLRFDYKDVPKKFQSCEDEGDYLFMNYALFGNARWLGSNSVFYWLENIDSSKHYSAFNARYLFSNFKMEAYYDRYAQELQELEKIYCAASSHGELLSIAIPLHKMSYVVPVGFNADNVLKIRIGSCGLTSDARLICDSLMRDPSSYYRLDNLEFVLKLTDDFALNPHSGIKIRSFYFLDEENKKKYEAKRNALFAKIQTDIERDRKTIRAAALDTRVIRARL